MNIFQSDTWSLHRKRLLRDLTLRFSSDAQHQELSSKHESAMKKVIKKAIKTSKQDIRFVPSKLENVSVGVFIDASFSTKEDYYSQLRFITLFMDDS